jgi:hypothetical protein
MVSNKEFISLFFPPGTFKYFDMEEINVKEGKEKYMGVYGFDDEYTVVFTEKEKLPEDPRMYQNKKLRTKGYSEVTLEDFPIRGRKTKLLFRIRKWQIEGEEGIIQRKLEISSEGVRYTGEFGFFFEERNRH